MSYDLTASIQPIFHVLAKSRLIGKSALILRNQLQQIVRYRLSSEGFDGHLNGEAMLLKILHGKVKRAIDVGANGGDWTQMLLEENGPTTQVLLFEPIDRLQLQLRSRFSENSSIQVFGVAMGETCGELPFYVAEGDGQRSSVVPTDNLASRPSKMVTLTTVDQEIAQRGWVEVDFLKIDTEGYDYHVLRGARAALKMQQIRLIQFEYNEQWASAGSTLWSATAFLEGYEYRVFLLRSGGLFTLNYKRYGEFYSYSNFVAVSKYSMPLIEPYLCGEFC